MNKTNLLGKFVVICGLYFQTNILDIISTSNVVQTASWDGIAPPASTNLAVVITGTNIVFIRPNVTTNLIIMHKDDNGWWHTYDVRIIREVPEAY